MVKDNNKKYKTTGIWLICLAFVVLIAAIIAFIINNGQTTNEVAISGSKDISGIKCVNDTKVESIIQGQSPISHKNTVIAAFTEDKLSSITYSYEGNYKDATEADHARDLAEASYYKSLSEKYGLDTSAFTKNISVGGDKVYLSITATDTKNLNSKTAPLFMLSDTQGFPDTLKAMKTAYENAGFICESED